MQRVETGLSSVTIFLGFLGGLIASAFGGWTSGLTALCIFMLIDYSTGLMVGGIFKNSTKTKDGALSSNECFKGLCKKGTTLFIILMAYHLDIVAGTDFIKTGTIIAYIVNESISITENLGQMGMYIPAPLRKGIEVLRDKEE